MVTLATLTAFIGTILLFQASRRDQKRRPLWGSLAGLCLLAALAGLFVMGGME